MRQIVTMFLSLSFNTSFVLTRHTYFIQDWAANYWVSQGVSKTKLIIGTATYGRSFRLADANTNGMGAAARGAGPAGQFTGEAGFLAYYEASV